MRTHPPLRARSGASASGAHPAILRLESLESREVPAILIQVDYSYDTGFFTHNAEARAAMERAATDLGNSLTANLAAITPSGSNTWTPTFYNPVTGGQVSIPNLAIGANTIKVFVGGRSLPGTEGGAGGPGGYSLSGSPTFINTVQTRGWAGYSTWGGSITFDSNLNWYFGQSAAGLGASQADFSSAATHELGHILGIGTSSQWNSLLSGSTFVGSNARAVYGGAVPVYADHSHWGDGVTINGQHAAMDPVLYRGQRVTWSSLDAAALRDLGWGATTLTPAPVVVNPAPVVSPPPAPAPAPAAPTFNRVPLNGPQLVAVAGGMDGTVGLYVASGGVLVPTGTRFTPFPGYRGEVRVAAGDFNGDGVNDYAFTVGAGPQTVVEIVNGRDGSMLVGQTVLFPGYTGGLSIAAGDIDRDGKDDLVVSLGAGVPPIVQTFRVVDGGLQLQSSFIAFNAAWFTGGVRVAVGDLNRDGYADVVVTTASAIGAVITYNGADLRNGAANALFTPFLPVPSIPAGLVAAVGDMDGDGYADLALGFDRGGPPIVAVWSGAIMTQNPNTPAIGLPLMGAFYALPPNETSGERLALRDLDGDGRADLIVGSGNKSNGLARLFTLSQVQAGGNAPYSYPLGTPYSVAGIYVG